MSGRSQQDRRAAGSPCPLHQEPEQLQGRERPNTSVGSTPLYKAEVGMTTSSGKFVGIDVVKDKLDIAVLGEKKASQVGNDEVGIAKLVKKLETLDLELIVVEATGGY